jgi:hypothetical protein
VEVGMMVGWNRWWVLAFASGGCGGDDASGGGDSDTSVTDAADDDDDDDSTAPDDAADDASTVSDDADGDGGTGSDPGMLFGDGGVWTLLSYDFGEGLEEVDDARQDAFLLRFESDLPVVTTATCGMEGEDTPQNSICRLSPGMTSWSCSCFAYALEGDQMQWREFEAGTTPPDFEFEPEVATDTYLAVSGGTVVGLVRLQPLPEGVFGSDGTSHEFEFAQRAASLFDEVYTDPEGACVPCIAP